MANVPQSRETFKISDSLKRQIHAYAQVASAAGVSVLALAGAADAKVIYTETYQATNTSFPLSIDLNHDGIKDFQLRTTFYVGSSGLEVGLDASGYRDTDNLVAGRRSSRSGYFLSVASALPAGARIGPNRNFPVRFPLMAAELFTGIGSQNSDIGPWVDKGKGVRDRYLGLKFFFGGEVHYGWARISITLGHHRQAGDVRGILTGYAFETIPGKPITAGEISGPDVITVQPESLGGLATGRK